MEGLSKIEVSVLFGELGGTPEAIPFSQVGVSPAREATFWNLEGFSVKYCHFKDVFHSMAKMQYLLAQRFLLI